MGPKRNSARAGIPHVKDLGEREEKRKREERREEKREQQEKEKRRDGKRSMEKRNEERRVGATGRKRGRETVIEREKVRNK